MTNYKFLTEGERVLWEGKPEPFKLLDQSYKNRIIATWIASVVVMIAFAVVYSSLVFAKGHNTSKDIICLVVVELIPLIFIFRPFTERKKILNATYVITDQKAVIVGGSNDKVLELTPNTKYKIETIPSGFDVLYLGDTVEKASPTSCRVLSIVGVESKEVGIYTGLVFYNIKNARQVCNAYLPSCTVKK